MKILQFFCITLALLSCTKSETVLLESLPEETLSECMEVKIELFEEDGMTCPTGAAVAEYHFQDSIVYVFNPGICISDGISEVTNNDCQNLGFLGGIAGFSEINGEDFWINAVFVSNIWEN